MTMYKLPISSTTSLSDDDYDEEPHKPVFHPEHPTHPFAVAPARWSNVRPNSIVPAMGSPMSHLPAEILIHILKHLHSTRDVLSALRVSRTWCECSVELLWHKPVFPKYETLKKMARSLVAPHQTFIYARFIRRLNLSTLSGGVRDEILSTFASCDRLERLTLINCENITVNALTRVLPSYPNLVAVDLTGVTNTTNEAVIGLALAAKRLQGINLAGCTNVSDEGILAFAQNCPMLRRVKLSGLTTLTDAPISAIAESCPLLLEIDLNHCHLITNVSIREIWIHSTHMREMRVSHCSLLTDAAFPAPPRMDGLVLHDTPHPFPVNTSDPSELPPLVLSRPLEHLRMLDLTACSLVTDDALEGIISYAPKIRNLVLSKCSLLTDRSVENICKLGRHLHYLHLGHAAKITDSSVRTLARSCTRLRYVDFANCVLLTDMSVFELSSLPKLRRIGLVRVNNLTDEAIYSLGERHTSLERIHLSYCDQISVLAVHFLLQKLDKLTHLSLTGVPAFRQPELQQFCRPPPKDFNSTQQSAFCVYSGKGVSQLRSFLSALFDHITDLNGTDDTEYEDEDEDDELFNVEDTPEPDDLLYADDGDADASQRMLSELAYAASVREYRYPTNPPPSHEFVFRRDRPIRGAAIPASRSTIAQVPPSVNIEGATNRLNAQILAASMSQGPSSSRRPVGQSSQGHHSMADILPIVEPPNSPPLSDVASNRSAGTNSVSFFWPHQEGALSVVSPRSNGAMTPEYNFAEIGHGRGSQMSSSTQTQPAAQRRELRREPMREEVYQASEQDAPMPRSFAATLERSRQDTRTRDPDWPYREPNDNAAYQDEEQPQGHQQLVPGPSDGRGRSVKRNLRNTLHVAENYASSFFFGHSSSRAGDPSGSPHQGSGSGSGAASRGR
ncbi:hypothetical protein DXG03_000260 [Asterophora parasitica]|uniref:F-box domain-containing protein n=1 Tax=Asterophora parasitica TaxID=117018 RepID=A0A9P7KE98_9AGAR|nr:hypothetical protein DXG03_000260 [Asterophora parasitica]